MLIIRNFSRHTPKNLEKYENRDPRKLTRGQKLQAIEDEYDAAKRNEDKYVLNKIAKWGTAGAVVGGAGLAKLAKRGKGRAALNGALLGGSIGVVAGHYRGKNIADREGHSPRLRAENLAARYDEIARKSHEADDYGAHARRHSNDRENYEMSRQARNAAWSSMMF